VGRSAETNFSSEEGLSMEKRHYTPQSYNRRASEWAGGEASYATFPTRTPEELAARFISDNERTAMLLLRESDPFHPDVAKWVERLVTDTTFTGPEPEPEYDPEEWINPKKAKRVDEAIIRLGLALIEHRLTSEEGHAYGFALRKGEFSPLSKAIVRYCYELNNIYVAELQRRELGL